MIFLVIAFIVVPIVELAVIIKVGGAIGIGPTVALLLIDSLLGAFLLRHQGRSAWVSFNRAMAESRIPAKEVLDGVLIIFGGALLLTPGFITDILGLALLIPPTRAIVRSFLKWIGISRLHWGPKAAYWGYGRVQKRKGRGPGEEPGAGANGRAKARPQAEDFSWEAPPPAAGPRPGDIEGTAHEVRDDGQALPPGERKPFAG
ncbi:MAG: FxsA family protein [Actinobacteria bacterium]|nr:FxsA family protein [Actinomycetota bacterium]